MCPHPVPPSGKCWPPPQIITECEHFRELCTCPCPHCKRSRHSSGRWAWKGETLGKAPTINLSGAPAPGSGGPSQIRRQHRGYQFLARGDVKQERERERETVSLDSLVQFSPLTPLWENSFLLFPGNVSLVFQEVCAEVSGFLLTMQECYSWTQ